MSGIYSDQPTDKSLEEELKKKEEIQKKRSAALDVARPHRKLFGGHADVKAEELKVEQVDVYHLPTAKPGEAGGRKHTTQSITPEFREKIVGIGSLFQLQTHFDSDKPDRDLKNPGNWVVYTMARIKFNDPDLKEVDFSGIPMPFAAEEKLILPVLFRAIERTNSYLESLNMNGCQLSDKFADEFVRALDGNKFLKHIQMESNNFGFKGMSDLAKAIGGNKQLRTFALSNQPHAKAYAGRLEPIYADEMEKNETLERLGIDCFNPTYRNRIDKVLEKNSRTIHKEFDKERGVLQATKEGAEPQPAMRGHKGHHEKQVGRGGSLQTTLQKTGPKRKIMFGGKKQATDFKAEDMAALGKEVGGKQVNVLKLQRRRGRGRGWVCILYHANETFVRGPAPIHIAT